MGDFEQHPPHEFVNKRVDVRPPEPLKPWLYADGSITRMAEQHCTDVRLKLLHNDWSPLAVSERQYYQMNEERAFLREINMLCDDAVWWYARTVIPQSTFEARLSAFEALESVPIGTILFSDPEIRRLELCVSELKQDHPLRHWAGVNLPYYVNRCWLRYSLYHISGLPLYMHEIFLPSMIDSLC